jgi:hypothetical protein
MKFLAYGLRSAVLAALFPLPAVGTPSTPKVLEPGWNPADHGYFFVAHKDAVRRRSEGDMPEYNNGARNITVMKPLKRRRLPSSVHKRGLDLEEVLHPIVNQDMFWAEDPST